jgi:hypothetical protein
VPRGLCGSWARALARLSGGFHFHGTCGRLDLDAGRPQSCGMNETKCWAEGLGGCGGPITIEHVVTKSLLGKRVRVEGQTGGWPDNEAVEISTRKLTANILCRDHNNELGRTADRAARRLLDGFRASHRPMNLPRSQILRPPVDRANLRCRVRSLALQDPLQPHGCEWDRILIRRTSAMLFYAQFRSLSTSSLRAPSGTISGSRIGGIRS